MSMSSTRENKKEDVSSSLLSSLHRNIRLSDWLGVHSTLDQASLTSASSSPHHVNRETLGVTPVPLILRPNSIGWTAMHFTALHGTPSISWWKWMLIKVLEEHNMLYQNVPNTIPNLEQNIRSNPSPFFVRTESGHSSTDLFFSKRLHPFPWETIEVRQTADRLLKCINDVLRKNNQQQENLGNRCNASNKKSQQQKLKQQQMLMEQIKRRIQSKIHEERIYQRKYGLKSQEHLSPIISENHIRHQQRTNSIRNSSSQATGTERYDELQQVMALHDHVHETIQYANNYHGPQHQQQDMSMTIQEIYINEENLEELITFWHEMELLLMAAVHGTLCLDEIDPIQDKNHNLDDVKINNNNTSSTYYNNSTNNNNCTSKKWRVLHALSKTGCPTEIALFAMALYPEQVKERDHCGNLPLHIASSSHSTSSLAEGTWDDQHQNNGETNNSLSSTSFKKQQQHSTRNGEIICAPMMKCLLQSYPEAALVLNSNQRLPLNLALLAGKYWDSGVRDIFTACPSVLLGEASRDVQTNLQSFMLAAAAISLESYESKNEHTDNDDSNEIKTSVNTYTEEEMCAMRNASKKIGSMWTFLPQKSKDLALIEATKDLEKMKLTTVFELLRIMPHAVCSNDG